VIFENKLVIFETYRVLHSPTFAQNN